MKNCEYLCNGIETTLEMALNKNTDIKTGKILVRACRSYAETYLGELEVLHGKGKSKLKKDGEEFFILDLVVDFNEAKVTFYKPNLLKLLKLDEDIDSFIETLIQPKSKYASNWLSLSKKKQESILSTHKQAYQYHNKKWNKLANAKPILQIKKPLVRKSEATVKQ